MVIKMKRLLEFESVLIVDEDGKIFLEQEAINGKVKGYNKETYENFYRIDGILAELINYLQIQCDYNYIKVEDGNGYMDDCIHEFINENNIEWYIKRDVLTLEYRGEEINLQLIKPDKEELEYIILNEDESYNIKNDYYTAIIMIN
jgi:hypothetical protein